MQKLLLFSLVVATVLIPIQAARHDSALVGLRRTMLGLMAWIAIYVVTVVYILPRLG